MAERVVAIIGDIGGQLQVFRQVLDDLGVDLRALTLPRGLSVIQVGDLVRVTSSSSLDSEGCLGLAHNLMETNGKRWVQLLGNHEAALLGGPRKTDWPDVEASPDLCDLLEDGWRSGRYALAAAIRSSGDDSLVTHAGLTVAGYTALGTPNSADGAAALLNEDVGRDPNVVFTGGRMTDPDLNCSTDVTWADAGPELYAPWLAQDQAPFHQVHGHASAWDWQRNRWWPDTPADVRLAVAVDTGRRRSRVRLADGHVLTGVDWALGDIALGRISWETLLVEGQIADEAIR